MPDNVPSYILTLHAPGYGTRNAERGWYLYDPMRESAGRGDYDWATWGDTWAGVAPMDSLYPSLEYIKEVDALICKPYPRFRDQIPLTDWNNVGVGKTTWETINILPNLPTNWYHQTDSSLAQGENGLLYVYMLPPNPAFGIGIMRSNLPPDTWNFATWSAYTRISWAAGQYELLIPFDRPALLRDHNLNPLMELDIKPGQFPVQGSQDWQAFFVWFMHVRGRILISSDNMRSWSVYGKGGLAENALNAISGELQVSHIGSSWKFCLVPLDFPATGVFTSKQFDKGYIPSNNVTGGGGNDALSGDWLVPEWVGQGGTSLAIEELTAGGRYCQYQATLQGISYPDDTNTTQFGQTPELYSVRLMNWPVTTTAAGSTDAIAAGDILSIEVEEDEQMEMSRLMLDLDNTAGQNYENLREYGCVNLQLIAAGGAQYFTVFDGYIYQPEPYQEVGSQKVRVTCVNKWLRFEDVKCTEADPCFAGWQIGDVIDWAAKRCGVDWDKTQFECSTILPDGEDGRAAWKPECGRSWGDFLKEVAAYEQKHLYFDGATLRYDSDPDETSVSWHFKTSAQSVQDAPVGSIPILGTLTAPRDPTDHRNEVRVIGQDADGRYLISVKRDPSNLNSVGWEKMLMVQDPAWDTQERVNLVCAKLFNRLYRFPPRQVHFRTYGDPALKRRQVIRLWGGDAKVNGATFRITRVTHRWTPETAPQFLTDISAQWLYGGN